MLGQRLHEAPWLLSLMSSWPYTSIDGKCMYKHHAAPVWDIWIPWNFICDTRKLQTAARIILLLSHTFRTIKSPVNIFTKKLWVVILELVASVACPALPSRRQVGSEYTDVLSADIPEAIRLAGPRLDDGAVSSLDRRDGALDKPANHGV